MFLTEPDVAGSSSQTLHVTSPAPREVWEKLARSNESAQVFQTPAWMDCLSATGLYEDTSRLYETPEGRSRVLPLARRRGRPTALATQASLP